MKKIFIISMMLVFGFSFSQETKSETSKEPTKIESTSPAKTENVTPSKSKSDIRIYLEMKRNTPNIYKLFDIPKRQRTKLC